MKTQILILLTMIVSFTAGATAPAEVKTETSCLVGGSSAAIFNFQKIKCEDGGSSCKKDDNSEKTEFKLIEGEYGPEIKFGDVRIFLNPTSVKESAPGPDGKVSANNSWCIIDPKYNKDHKISPVGQANCSRLTESKKLVGNRSELESIEIPGTGLKITPRFDETANPKKTKLYIDYADGSAKEKIIVDGVVEKKGSKSNSSMNVRTQNQKGNTTGKATAEIEGTTSDSADEVTSVTAFKKGCTNPFQGSKGQLDEKLDKPSAVATGLNGLCFTMRGSDRYATDVATTECLGDGYGVSMTKDTGRSGGVDGT